MSTIKQPSNIPFFSREPGGAILILVLMAALLALRFPDFFQSPNSGVIEPYGDGYKVYAVMEYHARYDTSCTFYQGMNYPYGEHVIPADAQPLISNTVKFISTYVVDITGYTRAILHFSLLLSILLCALFLFRLLIRLESPVWWAVAVATGITFLSPQLHRMVSHYGLSHTSALAIVLYLLLRLDETKSWRMSAWIALTVFCYSMIHFYFFAILAFFISFYFLFSFLRRPRWQKIPRYAFHYSIQILLPLAFFYFWMYHGDPIEGRTNQPWGFFVFHSIWEGVFTSLFQPHFQWVDDTVIRIEQVQYEGAAYIGLVAGIGALILLLRWVAAGFRKPIIQAGGARNGYLNKIFWAALALLLFSFGYPFTIPGLEWMLDYAGPIRQFRSVGRFNWAFYYVINIVVFTELWQWAKGRQWRVALSVLALALLYFEAYNSIYAVKIDLDEVPELQAGNRYSEIDGINYQEFQALLTVPYFNVGSDNLWFHGEGEIVPRALTLSTQTGLPTTSAMLTRTPLWQTLRQVQLILEPYRRPAILDDFPNQKPLLLLVANYQFGQQQERYQHLLDGTQLLYDTDAYRLFRLPLATFSERIESRVRGINYTLDNDTLSLYPHGPFLSRDSNRTFFYESFDSLRTNDYYRGGGAKQGPAASGVIAFDGPIPRQMAKGWYTFSVWMYVGEDLRARSEAQILEYLPEGEQEVYQQRFQVYGNIKAIDNDGWALLEFRFIPQLAESTIRFTIRNEELGQQPLFLDELLIRQEVDELYRREGNYVWKNNRWFSLD
ncbi:MAG: hypothetical protein H6573_26720 [Lewinellaceae bacterium]|nr:hypothetical protein [Phaeodactylibacter sp.]MCB0611681.1 hypothetical protein [Phaeodactylibacter sp.]MCB9351067.1 hypothetical protein [Lewinellaceae bacterium]